MVEHAPWPTLTARPISELAFTGWQRVRGCSLRGVFAQDGAIKDLDRSGLAAAVGRARHALVEYVDARRRERWDAPNPDWVRRAFHELLVIERSKLAVSWRPAEIPQVRRWPGLNLVEARLVRDLSGIGTPAWADGVSVKESVTRDGSKSGHTPRSAQRTLPPGRRMTEVVVRDEGRRLWGRLDRVERRDDKYAVVDLKLGIGLEREEIVARHREQMLFYAGLVESEYGVWPTLEIHAIAGPPLLIQYSAGEVDALRASVEEDRQRFNHQVENTLALATADASLKHCLNCPFKVVCPSFAENWAEITSEATTTTRMRLSLARGVVIEGHVTSSFAQVEIEQEAAYTAPEGRVMVTGLPVGLEVPRGTVLAVSRVAPANSDSVLRANWDSAIWIFDQ